MAWSAPRLIPRRLATIAEAPWFQRGVIAAIVANAVLLGIETSPNTAPWAKSAFTGPHLALSSLFVAEIGIRLGATWPTPRRFFRDPWNRFDVVVVALSLLPQAGPLALVARLARLLRLARMFLRRSRAAAADWHDVPVDWLPWAHRSAARGHSLRTGPADGPDPYACGGYP